ncbi:MAG: hypothetical protein CM15mP12_5610 [Gammaproteobacteria bacterium]|nr:MAG: hypothetical protein CM15mP12_5610 [Gammaproteobacteria bacterium]
MMSLQIPELKSTRHDYLKLQAAWMMDKYGNKHSASQIAQIKVVAPNMACDELIDPFKCMGGGGYHKIFPENVFFMRCLRFVMALINFRKVPD